MQLVACLCLFGAVVVSLLQGHADWGSLGWWTGASAACVVGSAYVDRFWDWFEEDLGERSWFESVVAIVTPFMAVAAASLPSRPSSALIGPLLTLPFVLICERWRHAHLAMAREAEDCESKDRL